jgi:acetyl esterase/lipase
MVSFQMVMVKWMLKQRGQMMAPDFDVQTLRNSTQDLSRFLAAVKDVSYRTENLAGRQAELADPENPQDDAIIVHIHGGGFVSGSARSSRPFTSYLSQQAKRRVYSLDYRLAPEHPFPAAVEDCFEQYRALTEVHPDKKIALIGESAGAMLVMVVALKARDQGLHTPVCVVANAPGADLTQEADRPKMNQTDLVLSHQAIKQIGKLYCPEEAHNPYASPRFADFPANHIAD